MLIGIVCGTAVTTSCDVIKAWPSKEVARMGVSTAALGAFLWLAQVMPPPVDAARDDESRLQGRWIVTSIEHPDFELQGSMSAPFRMQFRENQLVSSPSVSITYTFSVQYNSALGLRINRLHTIVLSKKTTVATYELGPDPGQITVVEKDGDKSRTRKGIYRFTDTGLELCLGLGSRTFPREFKASKHTTLFTLENVDEVVNDSHAEPDNSVARK
jgi:uncharacterized protein (TIGR03067 family)